MEEVDYQMKEVDYQMGNCYCVCDNCGKTTTISGTNYSDINEKLRSNHWIIRKVDGDWREFCSLKCCIKYSNK